MPARTLTDPYIQSLKPVSGRQTEHPDAKERGLVLRVSPQGTKTWTLRYRNAEGTQRRLKLGTYPATTLTAARRKAQDERRKFEEGADPAKIRREEKAKARIQQISTVADLAKTYFEASLTGRHRPNARPKRSATIELERDYFDRLLKPKFGRLPLAEFRRADLQRFLDSVGTSRPGAARICRNVVRQMYNFAIRREITEKNPAQFGEVQPTRAATA